MSMQRTAQRYRCIPLCYPDNYRWNRNTGRLDELRNTRRTQLSYCQDALDIIEGIKDPICVVSVVGDRRTGKSYIISQLQEPPTDECVFSIASGMRAHTIGIWMSTEVFYRTLDDGTRVAVLLLDTEGLGSIETMGQGDNAIFTLTVLISSVLIYNGIGVAKAEDLQKLRCVGDLASQIQVRSNSGIGGRDADDFYNFFPSFVWLLRDVSLKTKRVKRGKEVEVDVREYIVEEVLTRNTANSEDNDQIREYAEIGSAILTFFPIFEAYKLPPPSVDPDVVENIEDPAHRSDINPKFLALSKQFCDKIRTMMKPKKAWPQVGNITGWQFSQLIKRYIEAISTPGAMPNIESTWDQILKIQLKGEVEKAVSHYEDIMSPMLDSMPFEVSDLNSSHKQVYDEVVKQFREGTANIRNADMVDAAFRQLQDRIAKYNEDGTEVTDGLLFGYFIENRQASDKLCSELAARILEEQILPLEKKKFKSYSEVEDCIANAIGLYNSEAKGPRALPLLDSKLTKGITEFYFANIENLRKLEGFKPPELTKEETRRLQDHIRALEAEEQTKIQQEQLQQMKENSDRQIALMKENLKKEEEQRRKDQEQLIAAQERQREVDDARMREFYEERIKHVEELNEERAKRMESEAQMKEEMRRAEERRQQEHIEYLRREQQRIAQENERRLQQIAENHAKQMKQMQEESAMREAAARAEASRRSSRGGGCIIQ